MSRYVAMPRPRATFDDPEPMIPNLSVDERGPVDTGLVDSKGNRIMRLPEPLGFHVKAPSA